MLKHIFKLIWNRKSKNALIVAEIFFAFLILFSVLTFVFYNVSNYNQSLGFNPETLWITYINMEGRDSVSILQTKQTLSRELEQHANIKKTSWGSWSTPFGNSQSVYGNDDMGFYVLSHLYRTDENFLETAGVKLVEGRWFNEEDKNAKYPPVVMTKLLKEEYFKERPVMDSVISLSGERKVIGIVESFKYLGQFEDEMPLSFLYNPIEDSTNMVMTIRLEDGVGAAFEEELHNTISQLAKVDDLTINKVEQRRVRRNRSTLIPMIAMLIICGFLVLNVALGLFGVLWYNISKRKGEIGLRRVVGAVKTKITQQFILEILFIAGSGILLAILFCVQVPLMEFFEVPGKYFYQSILASTLLILVLVLICAFYPSNQAAQIAPAVALREE